LTGAWRGPHPAMRALEAEAASVVDFPALKRVLVVDDV
jgi:hypothetical protein